MVSLSDLFFGNSLEIWIYAILVFLCVLLFLRFFKFILVKWLASLAKKTKNHLDDLIVDVIQSIGWPVYIIFALYLGMNRLTVPDISGDILKYIVLVLTIFYATKMVIAVVQWFSGEIVKKREAEAGGKIDPSMIRFLTNFVKAILWVVASLLFLQNIGIEVTSLIAGLGIGGIAIAFALQNVLGDIFASISIFFDKPFEVGDYIVIGADSGTVEHIGIRSTRIKALKGNELVVSNRELTSERINNYKKMEKRRASFSFGITYNTPTTKMEKIPGIITDIIKNVKHADLDRVHFKEFGDSSLNYEVVFYTNKGAYSVYMDTQQEINLAIKKVFEKEKIEFAFPTQTIYLEK